MKRIGAVGLGLSALMISGCASLDTGPIRGKSGTVGWDVQDLRYRVSGSLTVWFYTLVLRETAGHAIQFERTESGSYGPNLSSGVREAAFQRNLAPYSQLRISSRDALADPRGIATKTVFRRFVGTDDAGGRVVVDVRIPLSTSTARRIEASFDTQPLPPGRSIELGDIKSAVGKWRGYIRDSYGFDTLFALTITQDGSFEAAVDEPVAYRFRGTVRIEDGRIRYSTTNETGLLTLYEGGGQRALDGRIHGKREVTPGIPSAYELDAALGVFTPVPGLTYTVDYDLRLEAQPSR